MLEPEPFPRPQLPETSDSNPGVAPTGSREMEVSDSPTVRSGSSARKARAIGSSQGIPLPLAGDRIDSFELEEAIGAGGMGAVFRALDTRLDRHVALKILPPEQAGDPEVVQRFYQEGRAAARLDNENIARVYTIDHDHKYHYIAFEYIEGTTIRQRVERQGPLPIDEAINFTLQIAGALVHAAERGVVHRDIKPSNIIVTPQGRAKLVDMGLARRFERGGDDGLTQSGMTLGTFDYISPEQARDPRDVDVRSDLYSLGCTLFHMLTGRPPFPEGTVLQKLLQHQEDLPPDVRALNPSVPPDLANILVKLMAKDRDRRYQTPEQLVRDLLTVAGALGLRSVSPEGLVWMAASHGPGWERHLVWAIPTLALAIVVAGLVWMGQDSGPPRPRVYPDSFPKVTIQPANSVAPRTDSSTAPTTRPTETTAPLKPRASEVVASAPRERTVDSTEDLLTILAEAPPRSVIILSEDGPYELGNGRGQRALTRLLQRDLTLKADAGVRPVLTLAHETGLSGKPAQTLLDFVGGHVTIEGVEFAADPSDRAESWSSIRCEDTELTLRRCVFRWPPGHSRMERGSAVHVRVSPSKDRAPTVQIDACHFDGGQVGILAQGAAEISLRDCTLGVGDPAIWFDNFKAESPVPADLWLRHVSLFLGETPVIRVEGTALRVKVEDSVVAPVRDLPGTLVATDIPDSLDWRGRSNVYSKVAVFLQPIGSQSQRDPVRSWSMWSDSPAQARETGSSYVQTRVWEESDPLAFLTRADENPLRAFRLASAFAGAKDLGARQGPFGALTTMETATTKGAIAYRGPSPEVTLPVERSSPERHETAVTPTTTAPSSTETAEPTTSKTNSATMPEMPVMPPMGIQPATTTTPSGGNAPEKEAVRTNETNVAKPNDIAADPEILRTAEQFQSALKQKDTHTGPLRIAADANWELPGLVLSGGARWVLRAEAGASRPRIRFRPAPADPKTPTAWSVWMELRSGALQLEGIDLVLAQSDAPRQGRWGGFSVWPGADLSLTNCTVTIEGQDAQSAVIVIPSGEIGEDVGRGLESSAAVVRLSDSLLRGGGDLVEVASGRRLDLELIDAVVSTSGSLLHAHGLPRGQVADPIKLTLSQVTARTAGGLVLLESAADEPELPVADVRVRDSILATTPQGAPLFRVDGQDGLASLRDRIKWEGHGVAYHEINAYRRDQSAEVGSIPNIYDRTSWVVAVGTKEASPVHADVKFAKKWNQDQPFWKLTRQDAQLSSESPALRSGADLQRVPEVPSVSK